MKFAILFAFAVFAFLAQADAKVALLGPQEISDRGLFIQNLKGQLAAAKENLEKMLSNAQDKLNEKINEAKIKVEHLIEQLKQTADKIKDSVFKAANDILDKVSDLEDELVKQATNAINKHDSHDYNAEYEQNEID